MKVQMKLIEKGRIGKYSDSKNTDVIARNIGPLLHNHLEPVEHSCVLQIKVDQVG